MVADKTLPLSCRCCPPVPAHPQVVVRRERLCIPVRRGRQGELPKGSVTLAASESGSTLYMEPQARLLVDRIAVCTELGCMRVALFDH